MNGLISKNRIINELLSFFLNLIGKKNTYRIIVTGKDYSRLEIFWGMIIIEKGEKREIDIHGTEKFFNYYVKNLEQKQFNVKRILQ